jgi:hypothetical protein
MKQPPLICKRLRCIRGPAIWRKVSDKSDGALTFAVETFLLLRVYKVYGWESAGCVAAHSCSLSSLHSGENKLLAGSPVLF